MSLIDIDFSYFGSPPRSPVDNFVDKVDNNIAGIIKKSVV